jgi:hypothetical protein
LPATGSSARAASAAVSTSTPRTCRVAAAETTMKAAMTTAKIVPPHTSARTSG